MQVKYLDKGVYLVGLGSLGLFRPDYALAGVLLFLFPYLYYTRRMGAFAHLALAGSVSFLWVLLAHAQYQYNQPLWTFFGLPIFTFLGWTLGLTGAYLLYAHWEQKYATPFGKFCAFTLFFWVLLILTESNSYHLFGIQNSLTASFQGLPLCDCIHAPRWMQIAYFLLGPLYFLLCEAIGLEHPHRKKGFY
jgi:hypothetical protein